MNLNSKIGILALLFCLLLPSSSPHDCDMHHHGPESGGFIEGEIGGYVDMLAEVALEEGCFGDVQVDAQQRSHIASCYETLTSPMIATDQFGRGPNVTSSGIGYVQPFVECHIEKRGFNSSGRLDADKVMKELEGASGNSEKIEFLKSALSTCLDAVSELNNVLQQFAMVSACLKVATIKYCHEDKQKCATVKVPESFSENLKACKEEMERRKAGADEDDVITLGGASNRRGRKRPRSRSRSRRHEHGHHPRRASGGRAIKPNSPPEMSTTSPLPPRDWEIYMCASYMNGFYEVASGFDIDALANIVSQFDGWENATGKREALVGAVRNCSAEYDGDPWEQAYSFGSCLYRDFNDLCGMNNNLSYIFFPRHFSEERHPAGRKSPMRESARHHTRRVMEMPLWGQRSMGSRWHRFNPPGFFHHHHRPWNFGRCNCTCVDDTTTESPEFLTENPNAEPLSP